jgi:hypothetical protein
MKRLHTVAVLAERLAHNRQRRASPGVGLTGLASVPEKLPIGHGVAALPYFCCNLMHKETKLIQTARET